MDARSKAIIEKLEQFGADPKPNFLHYTLFFLARQATPDVFDFIRERMENDYNLKPMEQYERETEIVVEQGVGCQIVKGKAFNYF